MADLKSIWFPIYIGDYLADTQGLTLAQHGAYFLAMMKYYRKRESLDDEELKEVCGVEFKRVCKFFVWCDGRWHHKRIDIELAKADEAMKKIQDKSMKGVERRRELGQLPKMPVRKIKLDDDGIL